MTSFMLTLSTLVGTIVGAGIFGLPYVLAQSGVLPSLFYFVVLGVVVALLHLFFGEICLRTEGKFRLIGYANKYLGTWGKTVSTFVLFFVLIGALLAYLILIGQFLQIVLAPVVALSATVLSMLFGIAASFFIFQGRQLITKFELLVNIAFFVVMGIIFLFAFPHFEARSIPLFNMSNVFLPFGVILFALTGFEAIPEIASFLKDTKKPIRLHAVIIAAAFVTAALFLLFALSVVGVSGTGTSPDALSGLLPILGEKIVFLGALFGVLAISSSFLILGNYLKNSLRHDFGVPYIPAVALALGIPLALFLAGFREFIAVIGVVGGVAGALEGIIIVLVLRKAQRHGDRTPEYSMRVPVVLLACMVLVLVAGALAELFL